MKKTWIGTTLILVMILLSACLPGGANPETDEMNFSEEEVQADDAQDGFEFSEEEIEDFESEDALEFTEEEVDDAETEDEVNIEEEVDEDSADSDPLPPLPPESEEITEKTWQALPPAGTSTWLITNEVGYMECPNITVNIGTESQEMVEMNIGPPPDLDLLLVQGLEDSGRIEFYRNLDDPETAIYQSEGYIPPGADSEVLYEIIFENLDGGELANELVGSIYGVFEETVDGQTGQCKIFRSFYGELVE